VLEGGTVIKYTNYFPVVPQITVMGPFVCATSPYRPAIFTAIDDDSVGQLIAGSTGTPLMHASYGVHGIWFKPPDPSGVVLEHVRFRHAGHAVLFERPGTVRHAQFQHCLYPIFGSEAFEVRAQNILAIDGRAGGAVFRPYHGTRIFGEHVTACTAMNLIDKDSASSLTLWNSLLVAITSIQNYAGRGIPIHGNVEIAGTNGVFQSTGAGFYYLATDSPHRDAVVSIPDAALERDLRKMTTWPPLVRTGDFLRDTILEPHAERDTNVLDRGYHYVPLDYCLNSLEVTNGTLTLAGGVAVGVYGASGIALREHGRLISAGTAEGLNRLVRYNTVQENSTNWGNASSGSFALLEVNATGAAAPVIDLRFTEMSHLAITTNSTVERRFLESGNGNAVNSLLLRDCQLRGVSLDLTSAIAAAQAVAMTNNLFECSIADLGTTAGQSPLVLDACNNLFFRGRVRFNNMAGAPTWRVRDNLFDTDVAPLANLVEASHNAFRSGLASFGGNARAGLEPDYVAGPMGRFYYPANGPATSLATLTGAGSRSASSAGLFHFTTSIRQARKGTSTNDIGFHYAAIGPGVTGKVGHWTMNELAGAHVADYSGNNLHGLAFGGPQRTSGAAGNGLSLDGVNDYVSVPNSLSLQLTNAFSIVFWFRKYGERPGWVRLVGKGSGNSRNYGVWDDSGGSRRLLLQFQNTDGVWQQIYSTTITTTNRWYHVAATFDGSTGRIYLDGRLDAAGPMNGIPKTDSSALSFAYAGEGRYLYGILDDIFLHDRALHPGEVTALLHGHAADSDGEGLADYLEDRDGNGSHDVGESNFTDPDTDYDGANDAQEAAENTDPNNPASFEPRLLANWSFDSPTNPWTASNGAEPAERTQVLQLPTRSGHFGAELVNSNSVLRYRDVELNGLANINLRHGTVVFSLAPYWASAGSACPSGDGGNGPGLPIELLSMGGFSIGVDAAGTNLMVKAPNNSGQIVTKVQTALRACVNEFPPASPMRIHVAYSDKQTAIYLDGRLAASGSGITDWPGASVRANGLFIGSSTNRTGQIEGIVDDVETWNTPISWWTNGWAFHATVGETPPSIRLTWNERGSSTYHVERRIPPEDDWTMLTPAPLTTTNYLDATVAIGQEYEYRVRAGATNLNQAVLLPDLPFETLLTGIRLPPDESPGHLLLIVDRTLTNNVEFANSIAQVTRDFSAEGWVVVRYDGPRHDDFTWANNPPRIAELKTWIASYFNAHPNDARAIVLLGHLPIPFSGAFNADGHGHRPLPTDCYYGDVDGLWTDSTNWIGLVSFPEYVPNIPGDGVFDQHYVPPNAAGRAAMELTVGRIDFQRLPVFAAGGNPRTEVDLLVQYLRKARAFRRGETSLPERIVYGAFFTSSDAQQRSDLDRVNMYRIAKRLSSATAGPFSHGMVEADFFEGQPAAVWGVLGGIAAGQDNVNGRIPERTYHGVSLHTAADLANGTSEPRIGFALTTSSWGCDWHRTNHLGRSLLAAATHGLAWSWAGRLKHVHWQYASAALGKTLGEGFLKTCNEAWEWPHRTTAQGLGTGVVRYSGLPSQGVHLFATLQGDPTLRQTPVPAPDTLKASTNATGRIVLQWDPTSEKGARYHVYRTTEGIGGNWSRLTSTPIAATTWTDSTPPAGSRRYKVRALRLKTTGSGSFTNISAGTVWP
jgi:hypothetical protein